MIEIQISALIFLALVAWYDFRDRYIPKIHFISGTAITTAIGYLTAGNTFLLYMAIFGTLFTLGGIIGVKTNAWYWGEAYVMPLLAAGSYGLNMLGFFGSMILLIPGTAWILRKTDYYDDEDEPLLPAFFLVVLVSWILEVLIF